MFLSVRSLLLAKPDMVISFLGLWQTTRVRLLRVALAIRRRLLECGQGDAGRLGGLQARQPRKVTAEAARIPELRYEADVGECRRRTEAERAGPVGQQRLAGLEPFLD